VLERAALMTDGAAIEGEQIERALAVARPARAADASLQVLQALQPQQPHASVSSPPGPALLRDAERAAIQAAAMAHKGSRAELARRLGISERSLYRKLRTIDSPD
jgi:DNA-binding NtrC family response regulator